MNKFKIYTLGCRLNFAESSEFAKQLIAKGFERVETGEKANFIIINSCSVTDTADKKDRQLINKVIRENPEAVLIVTGCYAQLQPERIAKIVGVDYVVGNHQKGKVIEIIEKHVAKQQDNRVLTHRDCSMPFFISSSTDDRTRCFIKVQDGCDYFCTYCTVPLARGESRNANISDIIKATDEAVASGFKEIVLSGINLADFGKSSGESFLELLQAIVKNEQAKGEGRVRYRIGSVEPNLLSGEIIELISQSTIIAPHFHIPLQSGSDDVLKLMKRRYNTKLFAERLQLIKTLIPHAFIGVDVIVGTRGETEEYFNNSLEFIKSQPISQLHVFSYSERPNTAALQIEHVVSEDDKKIRNKMLHDISEMKNAEFINSQKGTTRDVLWESNSKKDIMFGWTDNYIRVEAEYNKDLINTITSHKI